jgi:Uma2 family endonuclease
MSTVAPVLPDVDYPESDGEPMGETPIHRDQMAHVIEMLEDHYAADPEVYVSGNMMMYYVEGDPKKCVSPDVFVTLGIPKLPERRIYRTWIEGKGPDFLVEMHSRGTWRSDVGWKLDLYRDVLKVPEYFLFDPLEERPAVKALRGYRLIDGVYQPIPEIDGRLPSEVLGLHLEAAGERLRLFDPRRGVYLLDPREVREALAREEAARRAAEVKVEWEAVARAEAVAKAERESAARAAADAKAQQEAAARVAAEAEVERLRREIEELRRARPAGP